MLIYHILKDSWCYYEIKILENLGLIRVEKSKTCTCICFLQEIFLFKFKIVLLLNGLFFLCTIIKNLESLCEKFIKMALIIKLFLGSIFINIIKCTKW